MALAPTSSRGGGAGALTLLSTTTISGSANFFDVTGISGSYNDLVIIAMLRSSTAAGSDSPLITLNGDTGAAAYGTQWSAAVSGAAVVGQFTSRANILAGNCADSTSPANTFGGFYIEIPGYASTVWLKTIYTRWTNTQAVTAGNVNIGHSASAWNSTAAVTRVTIKSGHPNFAIGSTVRIYGRL